MWTTEVLVRPNVNIIQFLFEGRVQGSVELRGEQITDRNKDVFKMCAQALNEKPEEKKYTNVPAKPETSPSFD